MRLNFTKRILMMTAPLQVDINDIKIISLPNIDALSGFKCGEREIDRNIGKCCGHHQKYRNRIFCGVLRNIDLVVGFYCLGVDATSAEYLDEGILRANETYKFVPFIYINYLAVQAEYQNNKIGKVLLMNALQKCAHTIINIGIYGVALHAISDRAAGLYDRYGFRECGKSAKYPFMILPAQSVLDLFIK